MVKKKGKKQLDDDVWADSEILIAEEPNVQKEDMGSGGESDGGGLMAMISRAQKKKATKKEKGKKGAEKEDKKQIRDQADEPDVVQAPVDDFEDDYGVSKMASKKNKKNKKAQQLPSMDDMDFEASIPEGKKGKNKDKENKKAAVSIPEEEPVIKSSKQKEKERKERLKQEKKEKERAAQEKNKKKGGADVQESKSDKPAAGQEGGGKKKGAAEPAASSKRKGGPNIAALQKLLEAQRLAEEEERQRIEEEKRLEEEERKRIEEEERQKEEARRLKKEKEKAKKDQLRKEGKLLTKKEKEAKRKQEEFLRHLKESGAQIAGLQNDNEGETGEKAKPKRVVYGDNRRNKKDQKSKEEKAKEEEELKKQKAKQEEKKEEKEEEEDDWEALLESSAEEEEEDEEKKEEKAKKEEEEEEGEEEDGEDDEEMEQRIQAARQKREERTREAMKARSEDNLRSPICCILGHVDTGKTKLLDRIRQTDVQGGEAGGITQQIGATYFPRDAIVKKTTVVNKTGKLEFKVPGLLIIDTPGHESFTNLRSRGSSLCNIAILVVDIMHGLEQQTLESLRLLRDRKTPFVVALNKIDRIYDWKPTTDNGFRDSLKKQKPSVINEFNSRVERTMLAFAEQGLNSKLYYENKNFAKYVSLVPTSAITGEGIPDLLALLVSLTQSRMSNQLMYLSELEATILEVKVIEGLGTTIDVILSNGVINEGDRIVVCGTDGPIATNIRALLTPQPLRELRVKSAYVHHKSIKAAMGVKITAPGLEKVIAGSRLMVVGPEDDEDELADEIMSDLTNLQTNIDKAGKGVWVQASTLGSLEALLEFLRTSKIPVSGINIGPVHKKDVFRAASISQKNKEYAVMLCFDVKIEKEVMEYADELGLKVFTAEIIYHLFDEYTAYRKQLEDQKRIDAAPQAVFPCVLKMIPGAAFNKRDPIVIGVDVLEGQLRIGTPVCVVSVNAETKQREVINLGKVTSMEINHKTVNRVNRGEAGAGVAIKIECPVYETPKLYGRHFDDKSEIFSRITRASIDVLKTSFRSEMANDDWALVIKLKKILDIV